MKTRPELSVGEALVGLLEALAAVLEGFDAVDFLAAMLCGPSVRVLRALCTRCVRWVCVRRTHHAMGQVNCPMRCL